MEQGSTFAIHEGSARDAFAKLEVNNIKGCCGCKLHWALLLAFRQMRQATRLQLTKPIGAPSSQLELAQQVVVFRHGPLTLETWMFTAGWLSWYVENELRVHGSFCDGQPLQHR